MTRGIFFFYAKRRKFLFLRFSRQNVTSDMWPSSHMRKPATRLGPQAGFASRETSTLSAFAGRERRLAKFRRSGADSGLLVKQYPPTNIEICRSLLLPSFRSLALSTPNVMEIFNDIQCFHILLMTAFRPLRGAEHRGMLPETCNQSSETSLKWWRRSCADCRVSLIRWRSVGAKEANE